MKTVLITGASSGIGAACADIFAKNNYNLVLCARSVDKLEKLKKKIESGNKKVSVKVFGVDVSQKESVDNFYKQLGKTKIDILINNAGFALGLTSVADGDISDWDNMIDTNVKGLLYITQPALKAMIKNDSGHVINIGSIAGVTAYANGAVYAATKSAVKFISDALRKEVVDKNIRVTNIQPGMTETNFSVVRFKGDKEKAGNVYKGIKPLTAMDIAEAVYFTASVKSHVQINEITITPVNQASPEIVHKKK